MIVYDFTMNNTNNKQKEIGNESSNNEHMGACGHKDVRTGPDILFANTLTLFHFFVNKKKLQCLLMYFKDSITQPGRSRLLEFEKKT